MHKGVISGGEWEFMEQQKENADPGISETPGIISDSDEEDQDDTRTVTSYISAKTNVTKLSASAVSAISRASQKSITVLSNVCRKGGHRESTPSSEVLYPPPARSARSNSREGLTTLEEEFRARSRASAAKTSTNYQYDSDDGEDFREDVLVEEEETRAAIFYKRVSKVFRFSFHVICVPIHWILIQLIVFEKWLLSRSSSPIKVVPPMKLSVTRNLTVDHVCQQTAATTEFSTRQKCQKWAREFGWILWIALALILLGLALSGLEKTGVPELLSTTTTSIFSYISTRMSSRTLDGSIGSVLQSQQLPDPVQVKLPIYPPDTVSTATAELEPIASEVTYPSIDKIYEQSKINIRKEQERDAVHDQHLLNEILELKNRLRVVENSVNNAEYSKNEVRVRLDKMETASGLDTSSINKVLDQVMDVHIGDINGRKVTLRNLALVINEADAEKDTEDVHEAEVRISRNVDESLDNFREEMKNKYYTPPVPVTATIPVQEAPPIDIEALKEDLTKYLDKMMRQESNVCTPGTENGYVHKIVKMAIAKYDADKTGSADLALEPIGGSVVSTRSTKSSVKPTAVYTFFGLPFWHSPNNPRTIIQTGAVPGECWSYEGKEGFVVLQLVAPSVVTGFTLEHIPKQLSPFGHIESAPKNFTVVGLMDYNNPKTEFVYGSYVYEDNGVPIQYFHVQSMTNEAYPFVELKIHSNHGSIDFTCVYRFRVHGHITDSMKISPERV